MRHRFTLAFTMIVMALPAMAQTPGAMQIFPPAVPTPPKGEARVTVNYTVSDKLPTDADAGKILTTQSKAHETMYKIAAEECKVLLATVASECRIATINVTSNIPPHLPNAAVAEQTLLTTGSSTFIIKPRDETTP